MHNQEIVLEETKNANVQLFIKREDLIHPFISGNKFRKLKYNIAEAKRLNHDTLLTFGGAYSNHIAATAYAGFENNLKTIGVIRGEELLDKVEENPTLSFAKKHGMSFKFVSRSDYRRKEEPAFIASLKNTYHNSFIIPEGGTNDLAVKGCEEILEKEDFDFSDVDDLGQINKNDSYIDIHIDEVLNLSLIDEGRFPIKLLFVLKFVFSSHHFS